MKRTKFKIHTLNIIDFLFFFAIVKVYVIPQVVQQGLKISFIAIILLYLILKLKKNLINGGFWIGLLYIIPSVLGFIHNDLVAKQFLDGILNALCIYVSYSLVYYSAKKNKLDILINDLYIYNCIACGISLISVLILGRPIETSGTEYNYFFGSKFSTSYLFVVVVGLAYVKYYSDKLKDINRKIYIAFLIALELFISYWVGCSTTLVGGIFLILAVLFSGKYVKKLQKIVSAPIVAICSFIVPGFIAMNLSVVMMIPQIRNIVINVLHKSEGLTGRAYIYNNLMKIYLQKPFLGYGYNSEIVQRTTRVGNAQNGLFQVMIDFGICGVLAVIILIFKAFNASKNNLRFWGLKVVFLVLCVCSIAEISINYYFYLTLFLLLFSENYGAVDKHKDPLEMSTRRTESK